MNTLNTVLLLISLFILTPSMMYLFIYHVVNAIVSYQKYKTKTSVFTNIEGVKKIKYNVPQNLLKSQESLIEYKVFAHMGVAFGLLVIAIPLLYILLEFLKDFLPTLTH
jgi:hypothetical protein